MPQRNGKNPIRSARVGFGQSFNKSSEALSHHNANMGAGGICPGCQTVVPPKPGFRFSSLKCPKCGKSMAEGK